MRKEEAITISLRLPRKLLEWIDKVVSDGMFQSRSDFIREAVRYYLVKMEERSPKPVMG
jgi:Arc/MetJ-type ribon-helix-helix transcriptional regulator